jgi:hypothetical protein
VSIGLQRQLVFRIASGEAVDSREFWPVGTNDIQVGGSMEITFNVSFARWRVLLRCRENKSTAGELHRHRPTYGARRVWRSMPT